MHSVKSFIDDLKPILSEMDDKIRKYDKQLSESNFESDANIVSSLIE